MNRKYRKSVAEAEQEIAAGALAPEQSPYEDAQLHGEMTVNHIAVAREQMASAEATLARARARLQQRSTHG